MEENKLKSYKILAKTGGGEYEEKKSRFIGESFIIRSQDEAEEILAAITKKYWDAKHNCYAFILGQNSEISRCSDNGEPSGTAGKPILEVIKGQGLTNTLVVVTRYFGGTLLGTGGLVRAYTKAAQIALENSTIATMTLGAKLTVSVSYSNIDRMLHFFETESIQVDNPVYAEDVSYEITVENSILNEIKDKIIQLTNGQAKVTEKEKGYYPILK